MADAHLISNAGHTCEYVEMYLGCVSHERAPGTYLNITFAGHDVGARYVPPITPKTNRPVGPMRMQMQIYLSHKPQWV